VQDFEVDVAFQLRDFSSQHLRRWVHSLEGFLMRKFNRVSAISERMVDRLSGKGVKAEEAVLFPNWVDTSAIYPLSAPSPFREELGISQDSIVALYSGNMGLKQGLDLLIDASRRLASRPDIRWIFCGDGPYRESLVRMVGGARNISFLPLQPADQLNELLNLADIHLLPQKGDAADLVMPSKLTGIMASGRPVVATAGEGTQLATALIGKGITTPPGDVDAFVAAVLRLADDRELRARMGEEARKFATTHLNRDEILSRFERSLMEASGFSLANTQAGLSKSPLANP
jgi:colanic acid biosynthesis glycosyl transferase WcaI